MKLVIKLQLIGHIHIPTYYLVRAMISVCVVNEHFKRSWLSLGMSST